MKDKAWMFTPSEKTAFIERNGAATWNTLVNLSLLRNGSPVPPSPEERKWRAEMGEKDRVTV
ncbi:hypothetical protein [Solidesulfovibrio sp.]|uniref:hypothetical protein n=1 Tax=Solidesulfovibrio sp. TaxID=2910990 RepID=UPI002B211309|nr:hypothetical protein [Solidesulfovibrio sp.]MEA4856058.1 hypothetical protein [Solidesulfovibrio sp.]